MKKFILNCILFEFKKNYCTRTPACFIELFASIFHLRFFYLFAFFKQDSDFEEEMDIDKGSDSPGVCKSDEDVQEDEDGYSDIDNDSNFTTDWEIHIAMRKVINFNRFKKRLNVAAPYLTKGRSWKWPAWSSFYSSTCKSSYAQLIPSYVLANT